MILPQTILIVKQNIERFTVKSFRPFSPSYTCKTLQHQKHIKPLGALPLPPKLWRLLKFPVAGLSFSRTESDCQERGASGMLCTLDRLLSASALKSQATGIYKFFRAVSLCKGRKGSNKKRQIPVRVSVFRVSERLIF